MKTDLNKWRTLVQEDALDPDLPIIDAHHHVWEEPPAVGIEAYGRERFFSDKAESGHNVIATVPVDCHVHYRTSGPVPFRVVGETDYMEDLAQEGLRRGGRYGGSCAAIVPTADFRLGSAVGEILDAHLTASRRVRGIRFMTAREETLPAPPDNRPLGMIMSAEFREAFAEVGKRGLSFDAWVFQTQLDEVVDLARAFPDTTIILDHLGGPFVGGRFAGRAAESFEAGRNGLERVACCANVVLKIGGLNMTYAGVSAIGLPRPRTSEENAAVQRDYILTAIDLFGPQRCMFVSNFPIDMKGISYNLLWNTFKRVTEKFSSNERSDMFAGVADRTYRISDGN